MPLNKIADYQESFLTALRSLKAAPLATIRTAKTISPEVEAMLTAAAGDVSKLYS